MWWWEHLIGLTKMSLKKVLGRSRVTLPVLQNLVVEVEAILNDRPLTHVSPDFDDAETLTPAHLLHGHRIMSLPHEEVGEEDLEDLIFGESIYRCYSTSPITGISPGPVSITLET